MFEERLALKHLHTPIFYPINYTEKSTLVHFSFSHNATNSISVKNSIFNALYVFQNADFISGFLSTVDVVELQLHNIRILINTLVQRRSSRLKRHLGILTSLQLVFNTRLVHALEPFS